MELIAFAEKYCTEIFSRIDNKKIKALYPAQIMFLKSLQNNRFTHTTKSRQVLGMSTMLAVYCAWFLLFFKGERPGTIVVASSNRERACELLMKAQIILDAYMKEHSEMTQIINNKAKKQLSNENKAIAISTQVHSLCSLNIDAAIIDEAAYCPDLEDVLTCMLPTLHYNNGQLHLVSSPNGLTYFYKLKVANESIFYIQNYHYSLNPSAKQQVDEMRKTLSKEHFREEMELEFFEYSAPKDKILQFRIDNEMLSQLNQRLLIIDLSLSDYIRSLIRTDLGTA